jgi:hypothetical protein
VDASPLTRAGLGLRSPVTKDQGQHAIGTYEPPGEIVTGSFALD